MTEGDGPGSGETEERLGRLVGGLAHDLNNLLTAIGGRTELLLLDLEPGHPLREEIERIRQAAGEAARIVSRIVEAGGRSPSRRRRVEATDLLDGIEAHVLRRRRRGVRLVTFVESGLDPVEVDPAQIRSVLEALVDNAIEAMPGGGLLRIRASAVEIVRPRTSGASDPAPGRYLRIVVADPGIGMDRATLARVFEPYFSTKSPQPGRGLGLAAARQIVRQHGGSLLLDSQPGAGTEARIFLPLGE